MKRKFLLILLLMIPLFILGANPNSDYDRFREWDAQGEKIQEEAEAGLREILGENYDKKIEHSQKSSVKVEPKIEPEAVVKSEPEAEAVVKSEPEAVIKSEPEPEVVVEAEAVVKSEAEAVVKSEAEPEVKPALSITTEEQKIIVKTALSLLNASSIVVKGKRFTNDCSGVVYACYYAAGIDLQSYVSRYTGNGVVRIYKMVEDEDLLLSTNYPKAGDLIFWDNTYDKNRNGLWDDPLTHIGLVLSCDANGNIEYFHHYTGKGNRLEKMNLIHRNSGKVKKGEKEIIINNYLRPTYGQNRVSCLASNLYRRFGRAWLLK